MGICYRLFFIDEFNWEYVGFNRSKIADEVKAICPHAVLEADIYKLMVFDVHKTWPGLFINKVTYDYMMYTDDYTQGYPKLWPSEIT